MRKRLLALLLAACMPLLAGCADLNQVENLAIGVILGVDLTPENEIELSVVIPKITGGQDESGSGGSGGSGQLLYAASGEDFYKALSLLKWAVPRRLDLSQLTLIVVSETLARSERCAETADAIIATPRLYAAARLAVCKGSAKAFIGAEEPLIGTRISTELTATFEDYTRNGFIPDVTFSDVYYNLISVYSDPLAIYAEVSESAAGEENTAQPAAAMMPEQPQQPNIEMQHSNRFLGAVVFHDGKMAGRLSGEESMYCEILRGEQQSFPFSYGGQTFDLTTLGKPSIQIDLDSSPMKIDIVLQLSILPGHRNPDAEAIARALEDALRQSIETCRAMGAEPFRFAERAAASFSTFDEWTAFDWPSHFLTSDIAVSVLLHTDEA